MELEPKGLQITRTVATVLSGLAFLLCVAATIYLLSAPVYKGIETFTNADGTQTIETTKTLVEVNGRRVVYMLMLVTLVSGGPVLTALVFPWAQRLATWVCALLLAAFSILGAMTVGGAYMPGALLLLLAGIAMLFVRKEGDQEKR